MYTVTIKLLESGYKTIFTFKSLTEAEDKFYGEIKNAQEIWLRNARGNILNYFCLI